MKARPFVLFDLGGTLVDLKGIIASMAERLQSIRVRGPVPMALDWALGTAKLLPTAQGRKFRPEHEIAGDVLCALLEERGRSNPKGESVRLVAEAWGGFVKMCAFHSDASVDWLRKLRSKVAGLGLVTDGDTEAVAAVLDHLQLSDTFDSVTVSEAVRAYKPDPRIYRAALRSLRANPAVTVFVSDSTLDLQGAVGLGMAAAWIPRGLLPQPADAPPRTMVLSSLRDLDRIAGRFSRTGRFPSR